MAVTQHYGDLPAVVRLLPHMRKFRRGHQRFRGRSFSLVELMAPQLHRPEVRNWKHPQSLFIEGTTIFRVLMTFLPQRLNIPLPVRQSGGVVEELEIRGQEAAESLYVASVVG